MSKGKVLILDDEEPIVYSIEKHLKRAGYETVSAHNGKDGMEILNTAHPDMIILDLRMPVMDGMEFLSRLKLAPSDSYGVIVLTGHGDAEDMKRCFEMGISSFLKKPFNPYELLGLVNHSIALKVARQEVLNEVAERKKAEEELTNYRDHLEKMVDERTEELKNANEKLVGEIVERVRAEGMMKANEQKFEAIASTAMDSIVLINDIGVVSYWNPAAGKMFGYTDTEAIGNELELFEEPERLRECYGDDFFSSPGETGDYQHQRGVAEMVAIRNGGDKFPVEISAAMLHVQDERQIAMIIRDITERKDMTSALITHKEHLAELVEERTTEVREIYEQLVHSEKLGAIGRMTASIAHEFNNPVYGIQSVLEQVYSKVELAGEMKELVGSAVAECDRISGHIRKLQDFNQPSSGARDLVKIHEVIDDILMFCKKKFMDAGIRVELDYAPSMPFVLAVPDQIKQVILNILNNAEEAIVSTGGGVINIRTGIVDNMVEVEVADSGGGIPPENIEHIFEPFFSTKAVKGTGLGLSVSYGIMKDHGGSISVVGCREEGGAVFTVLLPIANVGEGGGRS